MMSRSIAKLARVTASSASTEATKVTDRHRNAQSGFRVSVVQRAINVEIPRATAPMSMPFWSRYAAWQPKLIGALWCLGIGCFIVLSSLQTSRGVQLASSTLVLLILCCCYLYSRHAKGPWTKELLRVVVICTATFLLIRYIYWRATESLPLQFGFLSIVFGVGLFVAELHGYINTMFGYFINTRPNSRNSPPLPADPSQLPHVDVYIPTYNEPPAIVRATVVAATQMRYPKEKLHVYVLDDGGTKEKLCDADLAKTGTARQRAQEIEAIAEKFGAQYITRADNRHAKAGNINSALKETSGDLLLILDCDHIPTVDFLEKTVGFFLADPKLFVLQTPHNFVSPDPLERNLEISETSPAESEMFYDVLQQGLDSWGASFFCGSAGLLRRSVLDELGGLSEQTVTEDIETTIDALSRGYSTAYFNYPMVSGLQPETCAEFIGQRTRWAQGMMQVFLLKNLWTKRGLKFVQRLLYTKFAFYWGFALARLFLFFGPPAFLLFSINLCNATPQEFLSYLAPALMASFITTQYFYGRVRWPFMSHLYETIQSIHVSRGVWNTLRNPRSPLFNVTPKGRVFDEDYVSSLSKPFYLLLALTTAALVAGTYRYLHEPENQAALAFVTGWAMFDVVFLLGALGIAFERRQLRSEPRVPHNEPVCLRTQHGAIVTGSIVDASASGLALLTHHAVAHKLKGQYQSPLVVEFPQRHVRLTAVLVSSCHTSTSSLRLGLAYHFTSAAEERAAIDIAFGSSDQLVRNNQRRYAGRSILVGFLYLLKFAFMYGVGHMRFLFSSSVSRNVGKKATAKLEMARFPSHHVDTVNRLFRKDACQQKHGIEKVPRIKSGYPV